MNDIVINKVNGGLGRREESQDGVSGLLANGVAVVGGVQLDTVYRLSSIADAVALLITQAYDESNKVLVYEHINEFFRVNPNGDLYLMLVAQSVSFKDMLDKSNQNAKKLLMEGQGKIKQLAVAYNPVTAVTNFTPASDAISKAQELANEEYSEHRPVQILLEGKGFDIASPVDFRTLNSKNVSVMIGQALSIRNKVVSSTSPFETYAAVGTLLGAVSIAAVNQNIGWINNFNVLGGSLASPGISGKVFTQIANGTVETLNDNGSIFFRTHTGIAGIYFNDSHTCTSVTEDFAYIENNRTIDKAIALIRTALLPKLNSPISVDSSTGKLSPEVIKSYEVDGVKALETMLSANEISDFDVYVDPNQNILSSSELKVKFQIVPTGTARKINVTIGFTNPF
jgi:hypothetical protein